MFARRQKHLLLVVRGAEYGRETAFAQVGSDVSRIDYDVVRVHASGRIMVNRQPIKRGSCARAVI